MAETVSFLCSDRCRHELPGGCEKMIKEINKKIGASTLLKGIALLSREELMSGDENEDSDHDPALFSWRRAVVSIFFAQK